MRKKVLITGGSGGLGYQLSRYFAKAGCDLLWVASSSPELEEAAIKMKKEFAGISIYTKAIDLSLTDSAKEVWEWATSMGVIDVMVNNAGFGVYGLVNDNDALAELKMIRCNVLAVYQLTRYGLSAMIERNEGTIINISSNSSFQPVPRMCTYASTKAFITHFSRGLSEELRMMGSKVKVMTVCPSAIADTGFKVRGGMENVKTFSGLAYTTCAEVAKDIWEGYRKQKDFIVSGWKMRFLYRIHHLIPYRLTQYLTRKETELYN